MASIASSSPEILIEHIASTTTRLRVGSGGIMLPNHSPLRVAEAFHTLAALHPGPHRSRDSGARPAPIPPRHVRCVRSTANSFPIRCASCSPCRAARSPPITRSDRCAWSRATCRCRRSGCSDRAARWRRLPDRSAWATASRGTSVPNPPQPAIRAYRQNFVPSEQFPSSHVILGVSVICAPTEEEAEYQAASTDLALGAAAPPRVHAAAQPRGSARVSVLAAGAGDRRGQPAAAFHRHAVQGREHDSQSGERHRRG